MMPIPTVESTAAPLPFLVEHGAWIWKALIGLAAVGAPGLARLRRRRRAAAHVARVVRVATSELRPGQIALRGRLSDADLRSSRQQVWGYRAPDVAAGPAGGAVLTVGDTRVQLVGDVEVAAGTRAKVNRRAGRTSAGTLIAWRQEMTITAGAEVVCVGQLEGDDAGAWTLRATADRRLEVYAIDHRGAAAPTARLRSLTHGALASLGMAILVCALGVAMTGRIAAAARTEDASLADIPRRVQLAAMTPTGRSAAMRWLDAAAEFPVGRLAIGRALTVARRQGVDLLPRLLRRLDRHDELLALAGRRGDEALAIEALLRLARFAEAADLARRSPAVELAVAVPIFVMAGRWADAAATVEQEAAMREPGAARDAIRCIAAWFRHKAGDRTGGEEFLRASQHNAACRVMAGAVAAERRTSFSPPRRYIPYGHWTALSELFEDGLTQCAIDHHRATGTEFWRIAYVALHHVSAETPVDPLDPASVDLAELRADSRRRCGSVWALLTGAADVAAADLDGDAVYTDAWMNTSDGYSPIDGAGSLRRGVYDEVALAYPRAHGRAAILAALDGDARQLVRYLRRRDLRHAHEVALGVAPRLMRGRAELAAALMWIPDDVDPPMTTSPVPDVAMWRAFRRSTILRLLGRGDLAAPDAAIVARVVEVLADRDKVLALAFWGAR